MAAEETKSSSQEALQNSLVLHKIFTYLPTNLLLSACSLVSRTWNREARKYVRDYRSCTACAPRHRYLVRTAEEFSANAIKTVCQFKENLDLLIFGMEQGGRVIPFNGIKISSFLKCKTCKSGPLLTDDWQAQNQRTCLMKLKRLEIAGRIDDKTDCPVHKPILAFIMEYSSELRSLKIESMDIVRNVLTSADWCPHFPKLEELIIPSIYYSEISATNKKAVGSLLKGAPNLKRIGAGTASALEMFPKEKLGLLEEFDFQLSQGWRSMDVLSALAEKGFGMKKLAVFQPAIEDQRQNLYYLRWRRQNLDEDAMNRSLRDQFDIALQKLLQTCQDNLEDIAFYDPYSLRHLSFPVLSNVKKFCISQNHVEKMQEFWNSIVSIHFDRDMPKLEEMRIITCTDARRWIDYLPETGYDEEGWPPNRFNQEISICKSVRKLTLDLQVNKINIPLLKCMFPNVNVLHINVRNTWVSQADPVCYAEIWEAWSHLEVVEITGNNNMLKRNHDAEFCGLSEAEVDLLRGKDEAFLRAVQLIPIRPSVVTMQNLRKLKIDLGFVATESQKRSCGTVKPWGRSVPPLPFISHLTEIVAFSRLIDSAISVVSTIQYVEEGEDHEDCKYCDNAYDEEPYYYSEGEYEDTIDYDLKPGSP